MATIITVYKQPKLIESLLRAMRHDGFHFYLHIDKKIDIKEYESLFDLPNVFLIKERLDIKWAGYSMIQALLCGINQALESGYQYDFINHISGQCYPIKPLKTIHDFFEEHKSHSFLSCEPPPSEWWDEAKLRYEHYHFQDFNFKGKHRLGKFFSTVFPKRKLPFLHTPYGGSRGAYWTITRDAAIYLTDYFRKYRVEKFFKYSWGPDEFLINTIIMNSDFSQNVINNNFRYIDWSEKKPNPKVLTVNDFDKLKQSDCFFARKFDLTVDDKIIEMINKNVLS